MVMAAAAERMCSVCMRMYSEWAGCSQRRLGGVAPVSVAARPRADESEPLSAEVSTGAKAHHTTYRCNVEAGRTRVVLYGTRTCTLNVGGTESCVYGPCRLVSVVELEVRETRAA